MNWKIKVKVSDFDEMGFSSKSQIGSLILKVVGFVSLRILGFDPLKAEVRDIAITIIHDGFFQKQQYG
jgi:hypothetical protein